MKFNETIEYKLSFRYGCTENITIDKMGIKFEVSNQTIFGSKTYIIILT